MVVEPFAAILDRKMRSPVAIFVLAIVTVPFASTLFPAK